MKLFESQVMKMSITSQHWFTLVLGGFHWGPNSQTNSHNKNQLVLQFGDNRF
jgi:hypothetical protein